MEKNKKLNIGIDINEILRARWLQFDKFYVEEFGEKGTPSGNPYVYDFFNEYKFEDTTEEVKYLNEEIPEDINPLDYEVDKKTGEAPVDYMAFKSEKNKLTAKEVYNRFLYQDYAYEIHAAAPLLYRQLDLHFEKFYKKYMDYVNFILVSKENWFTIPSTLFFLSKITSRVRNYKFVETNDEIWDGIDILITTDPELLNEKPKDDKKVIKILRPYNKKSPKGSIRSEILQLNDLNGNKKFEKIIGYKSKKTK
ncbi:MAG: hypothetical protein ACOC33_03470 [bacterium]